MSEYLGIESSTTISHSLDEQVAIPTFNVARLIEDALSYISHLEMDNVAALETRLKNRISSDETFNFFRSKERLNNTKLIIQYLVRFCDGLPDESAIKRDLVDPFRQMSEFVRYHIDMLNESDVVEAILREHVQLGLLKESNRWYYQGQISKSHQDYLKQLASAKRPNKEGYRSLFLTLCQVSRFWFAVRREEMPRCRRTDVFIYLFSVYLLRQV